MHNVVIVYANRPTNVQFSCDEKPYLIAALQPSSQACQTVNNVSVTTSGLLTGSRNDKCTADTWALTARPGQHIELVFRDYTSYDGATESSHDADTAAAAAADDDNDGESEDALNDRKPRFEICTNFGYRIVSGCQNKGKS